MEDELFYGAAYKGSKKFTQQDVIVTNATGFGAAADDYAERGIDLNEQLIMNKPATFFFRQGNDSMVGAGIYKHDVLVVDRSIKAKSGDLIICSVIGSELMARRLRQLADKSCLEMGNPSIGTIVLTEEMEFVPWGVVTCIIHLAHQNLVAFNEKKTPEAEREVKSFQIRL